MGLIGDKRVDEREGERVVLLEKHSLSVLSVVIDG